jgi:outer membrane protein
MATGNASKPRHGTVSESIHSALSIAIVGSWLFFFVPVTYAVPETLDWTRCVQEALTNNPSFRSAKYALAQAEHSLESSRGNYFPQISSTISTNRAISDGTARATMVTAGAGDNPLSQAAGWSGASQFSWDVTIKQSLITALKDRPLVDRREAERESSEAGLDKVAADLAYDLKTAFVSHLYTQELIDLSRTVRDRRQDNVRLVEIRFESGRENKGSVLRAQGSLAAALLDLQSAERALQVARAQLARALGRPSPGETLVKGELIAPRAPAAQDLLGVSQAVPQVRQAFASAKAASFDVAAARAATYPDVSAMASASRVGSRWVPQDNRLAVGVVVSVPIYTGGRQTEDIYAAGAGHARAEANLLAVRNQAVRDLSAGWANLTDATARVDVQKKLLEAAELQAEIARSQYSIGLLSFQQWDIFESALIDARKALLIAKKDALVTEAEWRRVQGLPITVESKS